MADSFLQHYDRYHPFFPIVLTWKIMREKNKLRKIALANRQKDYLKLAQNPAQLALHRAFQQCLSEQAAHWASYDYGEGYFYQSCAALGISGFRHTEGRAKAMDLAMHVKGKTVLEIGSNTGFLSLDIAPHAAYVTGFDVNPHLIAISELAAQHQQAHNVSFSVSSFETFAATQPFEVVLSFANHSTYDQNTSQSLDEYFARCAAHCAPGGLLLFESHPPEHEQGKLPEVIGLLEKYFAIKEQRVLDYGSFLDRGRTFIVAQKR